jgi:ABC-type nitrate/sulfonate/bicarbonate transport system substrate-binding protein
MRIPSEVPVISRERAMARIAGGLVAAPLLGGGAAMAQTPRSIGVGLTSGTAAEWPTYAADEFGFFKRYGIAPSLIVIGSVAATAQQLVAGSLDLGEISSTQIVEAVQGGAKLRYFCERMSTPPYSFVAQKQYKKYADLKGKLLIIGGVNDITVIFTQKMLASGGMKMSDVDFVYAGGTADRYAALKSGSVAAAILFPPFDFRAVDEGYSLLGTLAQVMPPFPFVGWATTDGYAQKNSDLVVAFTKGYLRGVHWLHDPSNRQRAIDLLVKRTNTAPDDAAKSYDVLVAKDRNIFPDSGVTAPRTFATVLDALAQIKILTPPLPPPSNFFDNQYVERANAQLKSER